MFLRKLTPSMSQLLAFESAARHQSFTKAAQELHLTQAAISRHVQALETLLQTQFFDRVGRQVRLTRDGERYAQEISHALHRIRSASTQVYGRRYEGRSLRLAVLPIFGSKWLMQRITRFYDRHPELQVDIHTRIGEPELALAGMDAYINLGSGVWEDVRQHHLLDARARVVVSPDLLKQKPIRTAKDLLSHRLLHVTEHSPGWKESLLASGVDPSGVRLGAQFEHTAHLIQAVISGLGVGLVSDLFVQEECRQGVLVMPDIPDFAEQYKSYYLLYQPERADFPPLQAFRDWLLDETSGLTQRGTPAAAR